LVATDLGKVGIELFHKNNDDIGDGSLMSGKIEITAVGRNSPQEWLAVKEVCRFRITGSTTQTPAADGWVLFRLLTPEWFTSVKT
jgi:hypothetical protein